MLSPSFLCKSTLYLESYFQYTDEYSFLFLVSVSIAIPMVRSHHREKRFGPSPANGYTSGSARRLGFWRRNKATNPDAAAVDTIPGHPTPGEVESGYKPETAGNNTTF